MVADNRCLRMSRTAAIKWSTWEQPIMALGVTKPSHMIITSSVSVNL